MKKYFTTILLILLSVNSFACLNGETKELKNGLSIYEDFEGSIPKGHDFFKHNYNDLIFELDSLYRKTNKIEYLSDIGYVYTIQKEFEKAIALYLEIEKREPNRYSTAANLGTIYELIGNNIKALEWINKAIKINSSSHNGSEWLHAKILEAKIKGGNSYNGFFLINTEFGNYDKPISNLSRNKIDLLYSSIYYQLNERISFIKEKDPIIAILLFELGNLSMLKQDINSANELYKMAKEYGLENELINIRIAYTNGYLAAPENNFIERSTNEEYDIPSTLALIFSIIFILALLFYLYKRNHKEKEKIIL